MTSEERFTAALQEMQVLHDRKALYGEEYPS